MGLSSQRLHDVEYYRPADNICKPRSIMRESAIHMGRDLKGHYAWWAKCSRLEFWADMKIQDTVNVSRLKKYTADQGCEKRPPPPVPSVWDQDGPISVHMLWQWLHGISGCWASKVARNIDSNGTATIKDQGNPPPISQKQSQCLVTDWANKDWENRWLFGKGRTQAVLSMAIGWTSSYSGWPVHFFIFKKYLEHLRRGVRWKWRKSWHMVWLFGAHRPERDMYLSAILCRLTGRESSLA